MPSASVMLEVTLYSSVVTEVVPSPGPPLHVPISSCWVCESVSIPTGKLVGCPDDMVVLGYRGAPCTVLWVSQRNEKTAVANEVV